MNSFIFSFPVDDESIRYFFLSDALRPLLLFSLFLILPSTLMAQRRRS